MKADMKPHKHKINTVVDKNSYIQRFELSTTYYNIT